MTDTTLNVFVGYGTAATRAAFTPAPATPASGFSPLYVYYETDTNLVWHYTTAWHCVSKPEGAFALPGDISPSQITSNQNDYNPTGLSTASTLRLSSDASRDVTGLQGGADGRILFVHNVGSNNIVLKDESASSSAANRFALTADVTLSADGVAVLQYDSTSSRWRAVSGGGGGGGGGTTTNAVTFNTSGGAAAGATFDGSVAKTIDYSTVGAAKTGAVTGSGLTQATAKLLGRTTASTGAIEEISVGSGLTLSAGSLSASGSASKSFAMPAGSYATNDTGSFATLGNIFTPVDDLSVDGLYGAWNNDTIGNVYSMFIATCASNGDITGTVATAASSFTTVATGIQMRKFALSAPVTLSAGTRYYLAIVRTNGTGTSACKAVNIVSATLSAYQNLAYDLTVSGANCRAWHAQNSTSPSSSTATSASSSGLYGVGMRCAVV